MKILKITIAIILLTTLALLTGCTGGVSGTPGNAKTSLKIVFNNTSSVSTPTILQNLGIAKLTLDVIPLNVSSFQPAQIDLYSSYQSTGTTTSSISNLTDNETYLFRIMGYDTNGNYIYGGQTYAKMLPSPATNTISITNFKFSGYSNLATRLYVVSASDGGGGTLTFDSTGKSTLGSGTWYLAPTNGGFNVFINDASGDHYTGTLDTSGSGGGTGTNSSGQSITWTCNPALAFTDSMISGKTFAIPSTDNGLASIHTYIYNANGTWSATGTYEPLTWSGTWSINANGNLIYTKIVDPYDNVSNLNVPHTMTLVSYTNTALTVSDNGTTVVMPYATPTANAPSGFTTAMVSGLSFNYSSTSATTGTIIFNANGTFTGTNNGTATSGTWSINTSGQLILGGSSSNTLSFVSYSPSVIKALSGSDTITFTPGTGSGTSSIAPYTFSSSYTDVAGLGITSLANLIYYYGGLYEMGFTNALFLQFDYSSNYGVNFNHSQQISGQTTTFPTIATSTWKYITITTAQIDGVIVNLAGAQAIRVDASPVNHPDLVFVVYNGVVIAGTATDATPTTVTGFTPTMLAGHTLTYTMTSGTAVYTFNATGNAYTVTGKGAGSGTWSVDSNGILILNATSYPAGTSYPSFFRLVSANGNNLTVQAAHNDTPTTWEPTVSNGVNLVIQ